MLSGGLNRGYRCVVTLGGSVGLRSAQTDSMHPAVLLWCIVEMSNVLGLRVIPDDEITCLPLMAVDEIRANEMIEQ